MIRDKRRKKQKRRRMLGIFLAICLLLAAAALVVVNVFTVKKVEVTGNKLYESKQIEEWVLNDEYSWNSLYVYLKYKFSDIREIPFIDTMEVRLKIPHTITIRVYEKGLLGYLYMDSIGQNVYFDKDGFVVETSSDTIENIPRITGLTCRNVTLYEKLDLENKKALSTLLNVSQILKKYNLVPDSIHYGDGGAIKLTYGSIDVNLGMTEHLNEKVKRLEQILPQLTGLSGVLHLEEWSEETTDITFEKDS